MKFTEALEELKNGHHIRRKNWAPNEYLFLKDSLVSYRTAKSAVYLVDNDYIGQAALSDNDEWELMTPTVDFITAVTQYKKFKRQNKHRNAVLYVDIFGNILWTNGCSWHPNTKDILAKDWVEVK